MRCTFCNTPNLTQVEHAGLSVHVCPSCRSTWLGPDLLDELVDNVRVDALITLEDSRRQMMRDRVADPAPEREAWEAGLPVRTVEAERIAFSRLARRRRIREKLRGRLDLGAEEIPAAV